MIVNLSNLSVGQRAYLNGILSKVQRPSPEMEADRVNIAWHQGIAKGKAEERQAIIDHLRSERWGVCTEDQQECCWYCTRLQASEAIERGQHLEGDNE